jgi:predicted RNA-binding protein with PUA-like domain
MSLKEINYWLIKSEPEVYSWDNIMFDKKTIWDGIRNYQARNNLRKMKTGDQILFYHSGKKPSICGVCTISKEAFPDRTTDGANWSAIEIEFNFSLNKPLPLSIIKTEASLKNMILLKQGRLSVMPVTKNEFDRILDLSGNNK